MQPLCRTSYLYCFHIVVEDLGIIFSCSLRSDGTVLPYNHGRARIGIAVVVPSCRQADRTAVVHPGWLMSLRVSQCLGRCTYVPRKWVVSILAAERNHSATARSCFCFYPPAEG